jgi:hypothetical protein
MYIIYIEREREIRRPLLVRGHQAAKGLLHPLSYVPFNPVSLHLPPSIHIFMYPVDCILLFMYSCIL